MSSPAPLPGPPLFLAGPGDLDGSTVTLAGQEGHHAAAVRRLRPGERADVSDGAGRLAQGIVAGVSRDSVTLTIVAVQEIPVPQPRLTVAQALPKGERGELAVELMTEVGVDVILPWAAERSVVRWQAERGARALARWRARAREAAKQSRRAWLPEIAGLTTTGELLRHAAACCTIVLEAGAPDRLAELPVPSSGEVLLVVGPEGGISPAESAALRQAGAAPARLGPTVLRTSTAGAAAAAVVAARTGRW